MLSEIRARDARGRVRGICLRHCCAAPRESSYTTLSTRHRYPRFHFERDTRSLRVVRLARCRKYATYAALYDAAGVVMLRAIRYVTAYRHQSLGQRRWRVVQVRVRDAYYS